MLLKQGMQASVPNHAARFSCQTCSVDKNADVVQHMSLAFNSFRTAADRNPPPCYRGLNTYLYFFGGFLIISMV